MQSFDYISEKLRVSPTLDPFLGMCRTLRVDLRRYYPLPDNRDLKYTLSVLLHTLNFTLAVDKAEHQCECLGIRYFRTLHG